MVKWFEVPAADFDRAVNFYNQVFDLSLTRFESDQEKMACFPDDGKTVSGAVFEAPGYQPSSDGVLLHFNYAADLNQFLKKVETAGGKIDRPKTKIEAKGRGYFALFLDSEGNRLGVYSDQ